ncbi:four helix bundle protein [Thiobacillus sp. 63-78]|uniref:four helix bundle protein n=1 Tax=Thiobacillus sp. 63-78 TaxID=1895859 RepID=UPI001AD3C8A2|nr:four helix bundle protein [Thiobacillus sp. 63-78]MBN8762873.1 four helix bundle protein [Thiobacillus sp.]
MNNYRDLKVWQMAMTLTEAIYRATESFPSRETYALANQLQRAAVSIPSNIAEGHARSSTKDYLRFVSISQGSLAEAETQLELAHRLGYIPEAVLHGLFEQTNEIGRMLHGLRSALTAKLSPTP